MEIVPYKKMEVVPYKKLIIGKSLLYKNHEREKEVKCKNNYLTILSYMIVKREQHEILKRFD
tara:strand:+ start:327 stop:512 length:186 start_codon:yes stop_codon:yes gene_type:complete